MEARELGFDTTLTTDEISLPRIRLIQPLSGEAMEGTAKPGEWVFPDGEARSEVVGVILGVRKCRYLRRDDLLLCSSIGGSVGEGDPGGDCTRCPFSQWSTDKEGHRVPPECTLLYEYLLSGDYGVAVVRISSRSAGAIAHQLNTQLHLFGAGGVEVTLASQFVQKPNRKYYIPRIAGVRPLKQVAAPKEEAVQLELAVED